MLRKSGTQYLIPIKDIKTIYGLIKKLNRDELPIEESAVMVNRLVKRIIYKFSENEWIRFMEGDIEYIGDTKRCTMAYISETQGEHKKDVIAVKIDNLEDHIHLMENFANKLIKSFANKFSVSQNKGDLLDIKKSYQENLRSKFLCKLDSVTYVIRFDVWAQIPDYTVVLVDLSSPGQNDFRGIVRQLKIMEYAHKIEDGKVIKLSDEEISDINETGKKTSVSIEKLYEMFHGKKASDIPYITFEPEIFKLFMSKDV